MFPMSNLAFKVDDKIVQELNLIQSEEGLGNRTSTITFLVKYYFLTKKRSLEESIDALEMALRKVDFKNLPSPKEQLKDI